MVEAVAHARATLEAGVTTTRDLGTEGAFDGDVQLERAIEKGVVPGPRIITTTRAIVATGSYGPRRSAYAFDPPQGAEEASGAEEITRVVRSQIGHGADWIKVYADYRWGPDGEALPTFSLDELRVLVETAHGSGRPVAAHAATAEGMRRATLAGVETIEHGDDGHGRGVPAHEEARRRALSDDRRGRGVRDLLRRMGEGEEGRRRPSWRPSARASAPRSPPA